MCFKHLCFSDRLTLSLEYVGNSWVLFEFLKLYANSHLGRTNDSLSGIETDLLMSLPA